MRMPPELACEFFATFARLEFALKEGGFRRDARGLAAPAWQRFAKSLEGKIALDEGSALAEAVSYLTADTPKVQMANGDWEPRALEGASPIAQAIDAAGRVRNNLFHGGKFGLDSPDGRDEKLVRSAMIVLKAIVEHNSEVHALFYEQF